MDVHEWIAVAALLVSSSAVIMTAITARRQAGRGYVEQLEKRVERLEEEVKECRDNSGRLVSENERLVRQNAGLMQELLECQRARRRED